MADENKNDNQTDIKDQKVAPEEEKERDEEGKDKEKPIDLEEVKIQTRFDEEKEDEDDDIDPEDKKTISKIVDKKVGKLQDEVEVNAFLVDKPEMAKYKPLILRYVKHPAYSNIPIKNIAAIVASEDMQKIGARKEREAQQQANNTKEGGRQKRGKSMGKIDWRTAPKEVVEKQIAKAKGMQI